MRKIDYLKQLMHQTKEHCEKTNRLRKKEMINQTIGTAVTKSVTIVMVVESDKRIEIGRIRMKPVIKLTKSDERLLNPSDTAITH